MLCHYQNASNRFEYRFEYYSALPHNLMCIPLTGQAVPRKVEQPANLAKREER